MRLHGGGLLSAGIPDELGGLLPPEPEATLLGATSSPGGPGSLALPTVIPLGSAPVVGSRPGAAAPVLLTAAAPAGVPPRLAIPRLEAPAALAAASTARVAPLPPSAAAGDRAATGAEEAAMWRALGEVIKAKVLMSARGSRGPCGLVGGDARAFAATTDPYDPWHADALGPASTTAALDGLPPVGPGLGLGALPRSAALGLPQLSRADVTPPPLGSGLLPPSIGPTVLEMMKGLDAAAPLDAEALLLWRLLGPSVPRRHRRPDQERRDCPQRGQSQGQQHCNFALARVFL